MVSRTWSVTLNTSIGSSAAPSSNSSVRIGSPNSSSHFDGSGTRPSGPSNGKNGVIGTYGTPSSRASDGTLPTSG